MKKLPKTPSTNPRDEMTGEVERTAESLVLDFEEGRGVLLRDLFALPKGEQKKVVAGMARHARKIASEAQQSMGK